VAQTRRIGTIGGTRYPAGNILVETLMRNLVALSALIFLAGAPAHATDVHPTVVGSPQDTNNDGLGDGLAAAPFEGLLRKVTSSSIENRAIQEFDLAAFASMSVQSATLSGLVSVNNSLDTGVRTYDFLLYAGNGAAEVSDYQIAATLAGTGSYHPPLTSSFRRQRHQMSRARSAAVV
jgi:hypothetical protein